MTLPALPDAGWIVPPDVTEPEPTQHERHPEPADDLIDVLNSLGTPRVLIIGDLILDRYTWGDAGRISPEAPVIILRSESCEHRPGGAASVGMMIGGLEAEATVIGIVGDDTEGEMLRRLLEQTGANTSAVLIDSGRPTTLKERFMGRAQHRHAHQILRVDREDRRPVSSRVQSDLLAKIEAAIVDHEIILISDYAKGVCQPALLAEIIAQARRLGRLVLIDPARGCDYRRYRGASCITPNRAEAQQSAGMTIGCPETALKVGREFCRSLDLEAAIITLDRDGMALVQTDGRETIYPTRPREVYDITGAGDMVLSMLGLALAGGASYEQAVRLASLAGGLEVEKVGVAPVSRREILAELAAGERNASKKLLTLNDLVERLAIRRKTGEVIVMTNGCFDLLHPGHLMSLEYAASLGDCLVVGLNSDTSVQRLKGAERPVLNQRERAMMLAALEIVDFVTIFESDTPLDLLQAIRPDYLVKGGGYSPDKVVGGDFVESYGGTVAISRWVDGWSTTDLIRRIRNQSMATD